MTSPLKLKQKVLIVGNSGVGKSALIQQYVDEIFTDTVATVAVDISVKKIVINNNVITLQIWDTAGQERHRAISKAYYRGADSCILVFDVTDRTSFKDLDSWRDEFLIQVNPQNSEHFPFVVLGNKVDLNNRNVSTEEAQLWCKKHKIPYFETSAKDGSSLKDAFKTVAQKVFATKAIDDDAGSFLLSKDPQVLKSSESLCTCTNNYVNINAEKCV
ncbi:ras-related protein Rab-7a-like [Drosophila innubila]|uniref:ras-related protein Rab-7a-like n=1 Tax=Drosophila innubila TaxID=198719 RepID=UPI00148C022F|nr:ras-related protein Rab-7a-like [Drosophila innubila]